MEINEIVRSLKDIEKSLDGKIDEKTKIGTDVLSEFKKAVAPNVDDVNRELHLNREYVFRCEKAKKQLEKALKHLSKIK